MTTGHQIAYRAAWVFPISQPPIRHGYVTVAGDYVVDVGSQAPLGAKIVDLGDAAILPKPVNAHTHLEFSDLAAPLGQRGMPFANWIAEVLALRGTRTTPKPDLIERGLAELESSLTAGVGEIATLPMSSSEYDRASLTGGVVFAELLSTDLDRGLARLDEIRAIGDAWSATTPLAFGLSPHAPYTVHWELFRRAIDLAAQRGWPVAMHLGESLDEMELLRSNAGRLHQLLIDRGVWNPAGLPRGIRLTDYLEQLAKAPRALAIHGNFFGEEEYQVLARHRDRMSLVICPRTCDYFLPTLPPIAELIAKGLSIAIGTDSRATNPDLSVWNETRFLLDRDLGLRPEQILELVTLAGATALGSLDRCGRIGKGVPISALTMVRLRNQEDRSEEAAAQILQGTLEKLPH